ncbi:MAG TPA: DUF6602 domain-containing protein [Gemmatimonadaceae bacterium]|nr:DUF6602 domain-containing protein [Gemmatimonadaceae bacterium]
MEAKLTLNRKVIGHPGAKGSATELEWTSMLSTYLPRRYCADKAFVLDCKGYLSDEIDIVIYDRQYSPFILHQNGVAFIPAECVYAIIEVKQTLSRTNIRYAQNKAASVRRLHRTSLPIQHAGGVHPARKPAHILAGIVALDGKLAKGNRDLLSGSTEHEMLNFGCSLKGGIYFQLPEIHPWQKNTPPYKLTVSEDSNGLVNFFMNLVSELQKVGTVGAMDMAAYLK